MIKINAEEISQYEVKCLFHVPGVIGGKAYIIRKEGVKSTIVEGVITDITCRKRNDSFCVKFLVNYEESLCIKTKEVIYGIDGFDTEDEAKTALALIGN